MVVGSLIGGGGNYLYHLLMGRMLGPVDYGVLASLISIIYLLSVPTSTLCLVIVKFVSALQGEKKLRGVSAFFRRITGKLLLFSLLFLLFFIVISPLAASFLHLNSILPLLILGVAFFGGIFSSINRAVLQGLLRFSYLAACGILEAGLKVITAVLLVIFGFKVNGALFALLVGVVAAYLFSLFPLRFLPPEGEEKSLNGREILTFALPVFFSILAFTSLYTTDIVLVRHFLPAYEAGFYSALANLGKIIFFTSSPVVMVMFPMVSERHSNGKDYQSLLFLSSGLVFLICLVIALVYFLTPQLMVKILYGRQYLAASPYLFLFAVFISLYSFSYLLTNFYLSIKKVKPVVFPVVAALAQVILISLFHQSLSEVIWISILILTLLFTALLLYYPFSDGKGKKKFTFGYRSCL